MTWSNGERLYNSLPAIYRVRDAAQGEPLRALLSVIEGEVELVEADIEGLYENWFIETCAEWAVPYIADLLGVRLLNITESDGGFSQRAYVANTLRYRRRKGTAAVLEQLARDVTGWPARVVEFFQLLGTSQHMNHIRPLNLRTPDLRDANRLELIGSPFETVTRTAEVRRIAGNRGRYNIPNVGLYLWRLQSYAITRSAARAVAGPPDGRYTFNPLGLDAPLFNRPQTETEIIHLAEEINAPGILRRRDLYDDLEGLRQALVEERTPRSLYFGDQPVFQLFLNEQFDSNDKPVAVPPEEILICDLSDWRQPPAAIEYQRIVTQPDGSQVGETIARPISVAVDPLLGRLTFPAGSEPEQLHVSYAYGFSGDVGGGPYQRRDVTATFPWQDVNWQVGVAQSPELTPVASEQIFSSLVDAVQAWNTQPAGTIGVIAILDNYSYAENLTGANAIQIPEGSRLLIIAAEWPKTEIPDSLGQQERKLGRFIAAGLRPHLLGNISVRGTAPGESADAGELFLDGLLVEGELRMLVGNLGRLQISHCTLAPGLGSLTVNASGTPGLQNDRLQISLIRSIVNAVILPASVPQLWLVDTIVNPANDTAIAAPGAAVTINTSTILGRTTGRSLEASESIFSEPVIVERRQTGCVRFSYVPGGSRTPRRYRCQPDLALAGVTDPVREMSIRTELTPIFTSVIYGDPAYLQLSQTCAEEIRTGAEDGAEMGVFHYLKQPQRAANLRIALDEYLPFGLEAGIFYVT